MENILNEDTSTYRRRWKHVERIGTDNMEMETCRAKNKGKTKVKLERGF
jgi:hypothetical protein